MWMNVVAFAAALGWWGTAFADTRFLFYELDFNISAGADPQLFDWTISFANIDTVTSGRTALEVWVSATPWTCSDNLHGAHKVAEIVNLGQVAAGVRIDLSGTASAGGWNPPAAGQYYAVLIATEQVASYAQNNGYRPRNCIWYTSPHSWAGQLLPEAGLWWNPAESGTGYTLVVRNGTLVLQMYTYLPDGEPQWYLTAGPMSNGNRSYSGTLDKYRGGQCASCPAYRAPQALGSDGPISIQFSNSNRATVTLPGGRVTTLVPFAF